MSVIENMQEFQLLPQKVQVRIFKGKSGVFIAELPEYDVSTEADTIWEIDSQINDLIFTLFDVPEEFQQLIRYVPEKPKRERRDIEKYLIFQKFIASEAGRLFR